MWNSIALRLTSLVSAKIGSVTALLRSALHWYGTQMIRQGDLLRQTGGAPF